MKTILRDFHADPELIAQYGEERIGYIATSADERLTEGAWSEARVLECMKARREAGLILAWLRTQPQTDSLDVWTRRLTESIARVDRYVSISADRRRLPRPHK